MPHAGLMDADSLGPEQAALLRSRLHLRGARRRFGQGRTAAGLAALYDSLTSGVDWFLADPGRRARTAYDSLEDRDDGPLYALLVRAGVVDGGFDFPAFRRLVFQRLDEGGPDEDWDAVLLAVEAVLAQLGVLPFDAAALPPEDPGTP